MRARAGVLVAIAIYTPTLAAAAVALVGPVVTFLITGWQVLTCEPKTHGRHTVNPCNTLFCVGGGVSVCACSSVSPITFFPACFLLILDSSSLHGESERERHGRLVANCTSLLSSWMHLFE